MQVSTDTISTGQAFSDVVQETALRPNWYSYKDLYLRSYVTDVANPYSVGGVVGSTNYSGYNGPVSLLIFVHIYWGFLL